MPRARNNKGKFIVIEGIDGAGTTTQTALISGWLRRRGISVLRTAEPSRGPVGRYIRKLLKLTAANPHELALLFAADRLDHIEREIRPALNSSIWVVSDRYKLSSLAYQSIECDPDWVSAINSKAAEPDLTILLDVPVKAAIERLEHRGSERERFETARKLERIRRNYLKLVGKGGVRIVVIDGTGSPKAVSSEIKKHILSML